MFCSHIFSHQYHKSEKDGFTFLVHHVSTLVYDWKDTYRSAVNTDAV